MFIFVLFYFVLPTRAVIFGASRLAFQFVCFAGVLLWPWPSVTCQRHFGMWDRHVGQKVGMWG